jgi:molybdenum cofactor cytidylyltransferase
MFAPAAIAPAAIEVVLLAAGHSRRMGGVDKLRLDTGNGQSLLARSVALYRALGMAVTLVRRPGQPDHAALFPGPGLTIVTNQSADADQATSVRTGLGAAQLAGPGLLIALADQPWLTPADITALVATFASHGGARIIVPRHAGQRGNPVLLPLAVARLLAARPTASPRGFIDANPDLVAWHEAPHDHFTRDIDTPTDAALLKDLAR